MGVYLNPGNEDFLQDRNSEMYVDKTGLLEFLNEEINTSNNHILVSCARGFGKSHAARMINAYYNILSHLHEAVPV